MSDAATPPDPGGLEARVRMLEIQVHILKELLGWQVYWDDEDFAPGPYVALDAFRRDPAQQEFPLERIDGLTEAEMEKV